MSYELRVMSYELANAVKKLRDSALRSKLITHHSSLITIFLTLFTLHSSLLTSCTKYSVECELIVQPRVMLTSGSAADTPAYLARVYAYYNIGRVPQNQNDPPEWLPGSYADADAGIIRNTATGEVRFHSLAGTQAEDNYVHLILTKSPVLLVAVDPVNRFYAWRTFEYEVPLERVLVPVVFRIYQWQQPYEDNKWRVISERSEISVPESEE